MVWMLIACGKPATVPPRACNGDAALCARTFDQLTIPATHNSMSNAQDGWYVPNQPDGLAAQLDFGIRGMLLDTYEVDGTLFFCHSVCSLGSLPMVEGLRIVYDFLEGHPDEVMALQFQDAITDEQTYAAFSESGLDSLVFAHTPGSPWPTLNEMVADGARVVVTAEVGGTAASWYQNAWSVYSDTPYEFASADEFNCDLNRGVATNDLFLINHWVADPFPDEQVAAEVNAYDVLYARASECAGTRGHTVNMLAVDWYTAGDLLEVSDALNGL